MNDKVFVDTNIFLYAFSNNDVRKQDIAKKAILNSATISIQIINETSNNLIKKFSFSEEKIQHFIKNSYQRYEVVDVSQDVFLIASDIRLRYKYSYYDSLVISAALLSNCSVLLSEDMQHMHVINNQLTIKNPFVSYKK